MSRSEMISWDRRDLQTESRKAEFASEHGRIFLIGLCTPIHPLLDIAILKEACPKVKSLKSDRLIEGSNTY